MGNKVAYSMFDGSGIMLIEYAKAGYQCYCFNADEGNHGEYFIKMKHENLHYVNMWIDENFIDRISKIGIPKPDIVFGFPDCTMFAQSGIKHVRSDDDIQVALKNAIMVETVGNHFGVPWMAENPVGRLSTLWRKPDFYFNPRDFGNYL
ncbi:TPA: DNA cytosine methyltransferase, partial [Escherichia coli]